MKLATLVALSGLCLLRASLGASPDFRTVENVAGVTLVRDAVNTRIRYYLPGDLQLSARADGRPGVDVLETRYRGNAITGDSGRESFRSLLVLSLQMPAPAPEQLGQVRHQLGRGIELRPVPVQRTELVIMHLPVADGGAVEGARMLSNGVADHGEAQPVSTWSERRVTLRLDPQSAQILNDSWKHGRLMLSLSYAVFGMGVAPSEPLASLTGSPEVVAQLQRLSQAVDSGARSETNRTPVLIKASALPVSIDAERWPTVWRRIDLNEGAPPGYPVLEARCYGLAELADKAPCEKQLVVEAESVAGVPAVCRIRFMRDRPEETVQLVRFRVAVRLDRPYRYRVESVFDDGTVEITPWMTDRPWSQLIDLSPGAMETEETLLNSPSN